MDKGRKVQSIRSAGNTGRRQCVAAYVVFWLLLSSCLAKDDTSDYRRVIDLNLDGSTARI